MFLAGPFNGRCFRIFGRLFLLVVVSSVVILFLQAHYSSCLILFFNLFVVLIWCSSCEFVVSFHFIRRVIVFLNFILQIFVRVDCLIFIRLSRLFNWFSSTSRCSRGCVFFYWIYLLYYLCKYLIISAKPQWLLC